MIIIIIVIIMISSLDLLFRRCLKDWEGHGGYHNHVTSQYIMYIHIWLNNDSDNERYTQKKEIKSYML